MIDTPISRGEWQLSSYRIRFIGAVTGIFVLSAGPAMAACGIGDAADAAVRVRVLQTELMVAALSCRGQLNPEYPSYYNKFVQKFAPELARHAKVLKAHFKSIYGSDALTEMDRFVTRIANDVSRRSMGASNFCAASAPLFARTLSADLEDLGAVAYAVASSQECVVLGSR